MATMKVDTAGGLLSVDISVGPLQKTFWSVSKRAPKGNGGYDAWVRVATFDNNSGGEVNQRVGVGDCGDLIGSQISIVFFVIRINQGESYKIKAAFSCETGAAITGGMQSDSGTLGQPHLTEQFDFEVVQ
jgi:hypothetical protein